MRRGIAALLLLGSTQWACLAWWRWVDGVVVDASLGVMLSELLGVTPRVAWDPVEWVLSALLRMTPGSVCLILAAYLTGRGWVVGLVAWAGRRIP